MKSLYVLSVCLVLIGCASREPQTATAPLANGETRGASEKASRDDIMEAVFRHMCEPGPVDQDLSSHHVGKDHKVYFLSVSPWHDPRADFMKRLGNLSAPVRPISAVEWKGQFMHDRATGERGAAFYIQSVIMLSNDEADVEAVMNLGGPKGSYGWFYRLARKDGRWTVVQERWKWVS